MPTGSTCRSTRASQSDFAQRSDAAARSMTRQLPQAPLPPVDSSSKRSSDPSPVASPTTPSNAEDPFALGVFHPEHRRPGRDRPLGPTPLDETASLDERIAGRLEVGHDDHLAGSVSVIHRLLTFVPGGMSASEGTSCLTDVLVVRRGDPGREVGRWGDRHRRRCRHGRLGRVGGQDGTRRKRGHRNPVGWSVSHEVMSTATTRPRRARGEGVASLDATGAQAAAGGAAGRMRA